MLTEFQLNEMLQMVLGGGEETLLMSHHQLAAHFPDYTVDQWREFITNNRIVDILDGETKILQRTKFNQMVQSLGSTNRNSTGLAAQVSALQRILEAESTKDGAVFVYTYVPLNVEQAKAPNTAQEAHDIFMNRQQSSQITARITRPSEPEETLFGNDY